MVRTIKKPWRLTFTKYGMTRSYINTKANVQRNAKSLRKLGYKVRTKALKKGYAVR